MKNIESNNFELIRENSVKKISTLIFLKCLIPFINTFFVLLDYQTNHFTRIP